MNKKFKDEFANICVSNELERKIFDMTINKKTKKKWFTKLVYLGLSAIMVCTLSLSVVYAKEIKQFFQNMWSSNIEFKNGEKETIIENGVFKKIPTTAKKVKNDNRPEMTENEIEDMLGFKILNYDNVTSKKMYYNTELNNNGTIGRIDIWYPKFIYESEEKFISVSISMLNENADSGFVSAFQEGLDATGEKELENTYISDNLGVKVIMFSNDWSAERLTAIFCYDNVLYEMIGKNSTEQEMKNIIENLHL